VGFTKILILRSDTVFKKKKSLIGWLGGELIIGELAYSTDASAMERYAVYLERN